MTTILQALKTYLEAYSGLATGAPVWVDFLGALPIEYSIVPLPGNTILEKYLNGGSRRQFSFAFQSVRSTADELERLESLGFFEVFAAWLESQTLSEQLPTLDTKQSATLIEAVTSAYLYEQGVSDTGIYQINCRLEYDQQP